MKVYDAGTSFKFNFTELSSGNLLLGLGWARGVSRVDPLGVVLQTHSYWSDTATGIGGIQACGENEFVFAAGYRKDTCSSGTSTILNRYPLLAKIDSLGNLLTLKHYSLGHGCSNVASDVAVTASGDLVTWGYDQDFFMFKVNSTLDPVWSKFFEHNGGVQFVKVLPGGDLLAGINMDTAGAVIARIDSDGDFLWCKSYVRPKGSVHDCIVESDSAFVVTGYTDSIGSTNGLALLPPDYSPALFMMKLNGQGDVQWCKGYQTTPLWYTRRGLHIAQTQGGAYVLLANIGIPDYNLPSRACLIKTDQNGDTLWTRVLGSQDYTFEAKALLTSSDGGLLFNGQIEGVLPGSLSGAPFIAKTDSLGHLPCSELMQVVQQVALFPVDSSFVLECLDGLTLLPAFLTDTLLDPIVTYDGCLITSMEQDLRPSLRMKVRPNPNSGHFTIEFQNALIRMSYYSVFDAQGRLLRQRALRTGSTFEEIDISSFGSGVYSVTITDVTGVRYESVVVE